MENKEPPIYDSFAEIYDTVMRQIDYIMWEAHVMDLTERWRKDIRDILSLACGTGSLEVLLAQKDYNVTCLDMSERMLQLARMKFEVLPEPPDTMCASMADFQIDKQFDLVLCLYDSLNYLLDKEEVLKAFRCAYDHLRPGGLYIFDVTTEYNIMKHFADYTFAENLDYFSYIWENTYNISTKICSSDLTIFEQIDNGLYEKHQETHEQKMYPLKDIREWLKSTGFEFRSMMDGFSKSAPKQRSERVHFVAQKPM